MSSMKSQLLKHFRPKPGEIWYVKDKEIRFQEKNREYKKSRPVLVVSTDIALHSERETINIIPLTTSKAPDALIFPIASALEDVSNDFTIDQNSCAVLSMYQPISLKYFDKKCAKVDDSCYYAIKATICQKLIGCDGFDLDLSS